MMATIIADTQKHFVKSHRQQGEKISGKLQHFKAFMFLNRMANK